MENTCNVSLQLDAGTYWIAWATDGSLTSGPWAPVITVNGQTTTGNGLQSIDDLVTFGDALDSGTGTVQGFPFVINGTAGAVPIANWAIVLGLLLIGAMVLFRYRKGFGISKA